MPAFRYLRPSTVPEALEMLAEGGEGAKILAGGQSLIPMITMGLAAPGTLVDINQLPELDYLSVDDESVRIGALVRHGALERPGEEVARAAPLLPLAAPFIGHSAIRNRGTFLGSLAHGDPAGEWPAVALALDAELKLVDSDGERWVRADDFFLGPLTTDLGEGELLVECRFLPAPAGTGASVQELALRHGDYAVVGVAVRLSVDGAGVVEEPRIALFGVGPTPIRAGPAESALLGEVDERHFPDVGMVASESADPSTDATASADYRKKMVGVFCRRALAEAYARARRA